MKGNIIVKKRDLNISERLIFYNKLVLIKWLKEDFGLSLRTMH